MTEYTEELYKLNTRSGHLEDEIEQVTRHVNGLRLSIQDEISLIKLQSVVEAY